MCVYVCVSNLCTYCYLHSSVGISSIMDECVEFCTMCVDRIILNEHLFCRVPGITVATDIICGFPTETKEVCFVSELVAGALTCSFS